MFSLNATHLRLEHADGIIATWFLDKNLLQLRRDDATLNDLRISLRRGCGNHKSISTTELSGENRSQVDPGTLANQLVNIFDNENNVSGTSHLIQGKKKTFVSARSPFSTDDVGNRKFE